MSSESYKSSLKKIYMDAVEKGTGELFKRAFMNQFWPVMQDHFSVYISQGKMVRFEKQFWKEIELVKSSKDIDKHKFIEIMYQASKKMAKQNGSKI